MIVTRLAIALLALGATTAGAQPVPCHTDSSVDAFVACAHAGTERYRDQAMAVLDGYRRIGSDFPGMGEHWIRIALVFDSTIDARQPEVLTYVVVGGVPRAAHGPHSYRRRKQTSAFGPCARRARGAESS